SKDRFLSLEHTMIESLKQSGTKRTWRRIRVRGSWLPDHAFVWAYWNGTMWNGFTVPMFTSQDASNLCAVMPSLVYVEARQVFAFPLLCRLRLLRRPADLAEYLSGFRSAVAGYCRNCHGRPGPPSHDCGERRHDVRERPTPFVKAKLKSMVSPIFARLRSMICGLPKSIQSLLGDCSPAPR
ncbi:hypothetical protein MKD50_29715, partial [Cupriavidus sp. WGtm5]